MTQANSNLKLYETLKPLNYDISNFIHVLYVTLFKLLEHSYDPTEQTLFEHLEHLCDPMEQTSVLILDSVESSNGYENTLCKIIIYTKETNKKTERSI